MPKHKNNISKWQDASTKINNMRFELERILKNFNEDDRRHPNFKMLIETILNNTNHVIEDIYPQYSPKKKKTSIFKNWKFWSIVASSPVIVEILTLLPDIIKYISKLLGGTP